MNYHKIYINGQWVDSLADDWIEVENPVDLSIIDKVPACHEEDVDRAVKAAHEAFYAWSKTDLESRIGLMKKAKEELIKDRDEIIRVLRTELGVNESYGTRTHVDGHINKIDGYLDVAKDFVWEEVMEDYLVVREPYGVVAALTPWNYPMGQIMIKIVPALLAGNTVVLKPSQTTPLTAYHIVDAFHRAGFPKGVLNLVPGRGREVGNVLADHPLVDLVSFTGSTSGGLQVYERAAKTGKKVVLEMGGKSAAILLDEDHYEQGVKSVLSSVYKNVGQTCSAWTRLLVPKEDMDKVKDLLRTYSDQYTFGNPWDGPKHIGPLVNRKQYDKVTAYIKKGVEEGADLFIGKEYDPFDASYLVGPTVFTDVTNDMTIAQEEIFGPVLCVIGYGSEEEAVAIANDSPYGLSGAVFGERDHAIEVAKKLRTGEVSINGFLSPNLSPFGGYKLSGIGREVGQYGFDEFLNTKAILIGK